MFLFFIRKIVSKYFHMGIPVKLFIQQVSRKQLYQIFTEIIQDELFEQHFKCGLCKDIFLHPQKLKKCDHVFCSSCIFKEKSWKFIQNFLRIQRSKISNFISLETKDLGSISKDIQSARHANWRFPTLKCLIQP